MADAHPTSRSPDDHGYVRGIDGLRAVAVLAVLIYHLVPRALPGGYVGVDVFFVISGYVVTGSLLRDAGRPFLSFIAAFYARRFRRILPALIVCLCVTVVFSLALIPHTELSSTLQTTSLSAFLGLSNFALARAGDEYFAARGEFNPFTHTWSLAVEEQFYLVFPLLAYFSIRPGQPRGRTTAAGLMALLCAASLLWCAWTTEHSPSDAYYMLGARFWELGAGATACVAGDVRRGAVLARFGGRGVAGGVGAALVAVSLWFAQPTAFPFPWAVPVVLGTTLVIVALAVSGTPGRLARLLASGPMVGVGLVSYSLYLWHWPVYALFRWTVGLNSAPTRSFALVLTALLAWMSYRWVETPTRRHAASKRLPSWAGVLAGLAMAGLGWTFSWQIYEHPWRFQQSVVSKNGRDWYANPLEDVRSSPVAPRCGVRTVSRDKGAVVTRAFLPYGCDSRQAWPTQRLFVIGDSHVGRYLRMLQFTSAVTGLTIRSHSYGGCGIATFLRPSASLDAPCRAFQTRVVEEILTTARPGDLVWLVALRVPRLADQTGPIDPKKVLADTQGAQALADRTLAEAEANNVVNRLTRAGLLVILDLAKPVFASPPFRCADSFNSMNPDCSAGFEISRASIEALRAPTTKAIERLTRANRSVRAWDPLPALCRDDVCPAFLGGRPLYIDGDHISGYSNEVLLPSFLRFLAAEFPPICSDGC